MALRGRADAMRRGGSSPEAIARAMHVARRQLCQVFEEQTPEPLRIVDGMAQAPGRPGTGVSWDEDAIKRYGIR